MIEQRMASLLPRVLTVVSGCRSAEHDPVALRDTDHRPMGPTAQGTMIALDASDDRASPARGLALARQRTGKPCEW